MADTFSAGRTKGEAGAEVLVERMGSQKLVEGKRQHKDLGVSGAEHVGASR